MSGLNLARIDALHDDVYSVLRNYERTCTKSGYATRTRRMFKKYKVIGALERIAGRRTLGIAELAESGQLDKTFEACVLKHQWAFSAKTIARSRKQLGVK